jgi:hypothetical protein
MLVGMVKASPSVIKSPTQFSLVTGFICPKQPDLLPAKNPAGGALRRRRGQSPQRNILEVLQSEINGDL